MSFALSPFWGDITSTIDWCEENYVYTRFVAEFWNTTSNLGIMCLSIVSLISARDFKLGLRFYLISIGLFVVGFSSWMFHMTLWYEMQIWDELSMVAVISLALLAAETKDNSLPLHRDKVAWLLALYFAVITGVYLKLRNPLFHQIAFGALVLTAMYRMYGHYQRLPRAKFVHGLANQLAVVSYFGAIVGFLLWNIDNECCLQLRVWRTHLGWPFEALLQFHAAWHILTGLGAHAGILASQYLFICMYGDYRHVQAGYVFGIPLYLRRVRGEKTE